MNFFLYSKKSGEPRYHCHVWSHSYYFPTLLFYDHIFFVWSTCLKYLEAWIKPCDNLLFGSFFSLASLWLFSFYLLVSLCFTKIKTVESHFHSSLPPNVIWELAVILLDRLCPCCPGGHSALLLSVQWKRSSVLARRWRECGICCGIRGYLCICRNNND